MKSRVDYNRGMLAIILYKVLSYVKNIEIKIYKTAILPVVLYRCENWSFTLSGEHRLRIFENILLRNILGPRREEDGSRRKLHNDEVHDLCSSPNIVRVIKSRRLRWTGYVVGIGRGEVLKGFGWEARMEETTGKA
jgi:hypothetical protein